MDTPASTVSDIGSSVENGKQTARKSTTPMRPRAPFKQQNFLAVRRKSESPQLSEESEAINEESESPKADEDFSNRRKGFGWNKRKTRPPSRSPQVNRPSTSFASNHPFGIQHPIGVGRGKGCMKRLKQLHNRRNAMVASASGLPTPRSDSEESQILRSVALRNIRNRVATELCIPRSSMRRVTIEILKAECQRMGEQNPFRIQAAALEAIREASESYLIGLFEDANLATIHARRVTLFPRDLMLVRRWADRTINRGRAQT